MTKTVEADAAAAKTRKTSDAAPGFPALGGFAPQDVGDAMAANRKMMEAMVAANQEIVAFVGKRARADVEAFARLCQCRDWTEMVGVQVDFMSRLAEDYFAETGKMMERAAQMMEQGPIRGAEAKKAKET